MRIIIHIVLITCHKMLLIQHRNTVKIGGLQVGVDKVHDLLYCLIPQIIGIDAITVRQQKIRHRSCAHTVIVHRTGKLHHI